MKQKIKATNKRLVAIAFNTDGKIDEETMSALRRQGLKDSDSTQTIIFNDDALGGQAAFVFEVYDAKHSSLVQRIRHFVRKGIAAAFANVWNRVFVFVIVKGERSMFPVHGA